MILSFYPVWHARRHGGLFLGLRIDCPVSLVDFDATDGIETEFNRVSICLGFLFFSMRVYLDYGHRPGP